MSTINHDSRILNNNWHIDDNFIEKNKNDLQENLNPLNLQKNFLTLLITQIKNQDPTNPIKNTELTTQLAQINTASGIEKLNNTVENFSNQINQHKNIEASSLIGHHVMIPVDKITLTENNQVKFGIELIGKATSIKIEITDSTGKILHTINKKEDNIESGIYNFVWDGKDLNKNNVKTGKYNIVVTAQDNEKNVPTKNLQEVLVKSVITKNNDDPILDLGSAGTITFSKIREILA